MLKASEKLSLIFFWGVPSDDPTGPIFLTPRLSTKTLLSIFKSEHELSRRPLRGVLNLATVGVLSKRGFQVLASSATGESADRFAEDVWM